MVYAGYLSLGQPNQSSGTLLQIPKQAGVTKR